MIRRLRVLIIALVVLAALFVVADRVSLRLAQDEVRDQVLRHAPWTGGRTLVHVGGFPFLTQVVRGDYRQVEVRAEDVTINEVPDVTLQATLRGVHASLSDLRSQRLDEVPVDRIDGTAQVTYDAVAQRITAAGASLGLTAAELRSNDGDLEIQVQLDVLGQRVSGVASGTLAVSGGALRITATGLDVQGSAADLAAQAALAALNAVLTNVAVLPNLPYGLKLTSVSLTSSGIQADASAADVTV